MHHDLKCLSPFFRAVIDGKKNFEIRVNDRGFNAGDTVTLIEVDHLDGNPAWAETVPTGATSAWVIGYVTSFAQLPGYVVFSLLPAFRGSPPVPPAEREAGGG